ncbi:MAG: DNA repair protein RecO [Alphaproteobacteria bacterium]|nr:DNA repair protein RecO [Alphaproteobacteria bacterium]
MESWKDQGIVLSARPHGENGAIVSLLTEEQGRHAGYVRGAQGTKLRGSLEVGNIVDASWQSRTSDSLGSFSLELSRGTAALFMQDPIKLSALQSACALCDEALPEREKHAGLYHGLCALFETLESDIWGAAYVMWEIAFLKELGFSLDLTQCAGGGDNGALTYVSPKTGRAVSAEQGEPYKDKLLNLPPFLKPESGEINEQGVLEGLRMTGYFLEHWVFTHHSRGVPPARLLFQERFAKTVESSHLEENKEYHAAG